MMPSFVTLEGQTLHYGFHRGQGSGPAVIFANALGTDLRIWDAVVDVLPVETSVLRLDKRGHGLSPKGRISIDMLAQDMAHLMDHLGLKDAIVCGVSVGGIITQTLAAARTDLVKSMVLCCTGLQIGSPDIWTPRIKLLRNDGLQAISASILERWFAPGFAAAHPEMIAGYQTMLSNSDSEGYARTCEAIRDCDLTSLAPTLTQPTTCIAGEADLAVSIETVRQMADCIPNTLLIELTGVGHLPCIEAPDRVAQTIANHMVLQ